MSTTLPLFWNLSSNSKTDRIEASVKLVGALEQFQAKFTPLFPESSSEIEDEDEQMDADIGASKDDLDGPNAPDVAYSIRRLVRGLASPRESSRLGFAVALTELLSRLDTVSASQVLSLITQTTQIHGSMKGQEERDILFARLFGITTLTRSGILFRSTPLPTSSTPACALRDFQAAMTMLLALPAKKSYLKEPSYWAFLLALRALSASAVEWKGDAWGWVTEKLFITDKSWSPEKVGVALSIQSLGVELDWENLLAPMFKNGDILSLGNFSNLAKILRDADIEDPETGTANKKSNAWKPQLHFVWSLILDIFYPPPGAATSELKFNTSFPDFFKLVVDDYLLAATSSDGRKLWGFEIFRLSLTRVTASELPRMFTPNFMRSWVNHLSKPNRYLHRAAKLIASSLPPVIASHSSAGFPILLQLLHTHGRFDRLTRTKTVESMLATMDAQGVQEYVLHLGQLACKPSMKMSGAGEDDPNVTRIWVTDQFMTLVRNGAIPKADAWISDILDFLLLHSCFGIKRKNEKSKNRWLHVLPVPAFSEEARNACRSRLLSCLAEVTTQTVLIKIGDNNTARSTGVTSDGQLWLSKVLLQVVDLEQDEKHVVRLGRDDEGVQAEIVLRDQTLEAVKRLKTVKLSRTEPREGAELLLMATLLYCYLTDKQGNYDNLETCIESIARLFPAPEEEVKKKTQKITRHQSAEDEDPDDNEVAPIDVVVDTLIGYLENSTLYLRVIANQVFGLLTGLVNKSTVDLILTQLERRDPTRDDSQGGLDDSVEEDTQSDKGNSDSETDSVDIEEDPELRQKIENALRVNGIHTADQGSGTETGSNSSDEDVMNDDQMMQLDEHLAEIFRSRAKGKDRQDPGAQREATHFKNRVLDLVDIFLRKEPTSEYTPTFVLPLIQVIMGAGPDEKQLSDKATALIRSRFSKAKDIPTALDVPQLRSTLGELHVHARKTHSPDVRATISSCSLYLTKILLSEPISDDQHVIDIYRTSLADFATRKSSLLQSGFIKDFVRRHPLSAWQLRDDFVQLAVKAVNVYRKCQIFQLLQPLLSQLASLESSHSKIIDFMEKLRQAVYSVISNACDDPESMSASQIKELLKLSLLAVRQTKRVTNVPADLQTAWDVSSLALITKKLEVSRFKTSTSLRGLFQQLLTAIGSDTKTVVNDKEQIGNQKKRKADGTKEINTTGPRRKKTKKMRDNLIS